MAADALGHTFGVRVQRVKGFRGFRGLYRKVLKMDRPGGRRVLKFDGAFGPRGVGAPFGAQRTHFALCELDL